MRVECGVLPASAALAGPWPVHRDEIGMENIVDSGHTRTTGNLKLDRYKKSLNTCSRYSRMLVQMQLPIHQRGANSFELNWESQTPRHA